MQMGSRDSARKEPGLMAERWAFAFPEDRDPMAMAQP
jgi:hypothetical protein